MSPFGTPPAADRLHQGIDYEKLPRPLDSDGPHRGSLPLPDGMHRSVCRGTWSGLLCAELPGGRLGWHGILHGSHLSRRGMEWRLLSESLQGFVCGLAQRFRQRLFGAGRFGLLGWRLRKRHRMAGWFSLLGWRVGFLEWGRRAVRFLERGTALSRQKNESPGSSRKEWGRLCECRNLSTKPRTGIFPSSGGGAGRGRAAWES